eukprot:gnl/MRDRNA2_/MRDRNA2_30212_c0_seq1.p1 gnl/MRDRNA2_/MRDRNA2_30212_c0~~gnl/MRDRNA2_/MRDRNA2_30212_c0_seq1.p1  ORF type:complete len:163 (-),score=28.83 gnl/MRDRNA2_/MRDRNA2_30212_c0_seq1:145-633(-)
MFANCCVCERPTQTSGQDKQPPVRQNSTSAEDAEQEKAQLRKLLEQFVRDAKEGCDCIIVGSTGVRSPSKYAIGSCLGEFTFSAMPQVKLDLSQMQEAAICSSMTGKKSGLKLSTSEEARTIYIRTAEQVELYLLFPSVELAQRFETCSKILQIYCQSDSPQ